MTPKRTSYSSSDHRTYEDKPHGFEACGNFAVGMSFRRTQAASMTR